MSDFIPGHRYSYMERTLNSQTVNSQAPIKDPLTSKVIGCAINVHRTLGPGMLESAYEACLSWELRQAGLHVECQVGQPIYYGDMELETGFRMDMVVENRLIIELKTVDRLSSLHQAQLLTYLRFSGIQTGLILNFNTKNLPTASSGLFYNKFECDRSIKIFHTRQYCIHK
jgi:GxxExxY protein